MRYGRPGFTIMELLVTIGILSVVMTLLIYPIISAYSYIQKAEARTDARTIGDQVAQRFKTELDAAAYIFDLPPDGSMITFIPGNTDGKTLDTDRKVSIVRYAQVLDFPWALRPYGMNSEQWVLLQPNYLTVYNASWAHDTYYGDPVHEAENGHYAPFHMSARQRLTPNPYILPRFSEEKIDWTLAKVHAFDGSYPMSEMATRNTDGTLRTRAVLQQTFHNRMISLGPLGEKWDVARFQVTPFRVVDEALPMQTDAFGHKDTSLVVSRYPMWAGRNLDCDQIDIKIADETKRLEAYAKLQAVYGPYQGEFDPDAFTGQLLNAGVLTTITAVATDGANYTVAHTGRIRAGMLLMIQDKTTGRMLKPIRVDHLDAEGKVYPEVAMIVPVGSPVYLMGFYPYGSNPFGYQIRVFDKDGGLVYGYNPGSQSLKHQRHFIDWPPMERPDWDANAPFWTREDVDRQRLEGKLLFAQPMVCSPITLADVTDRIMLPIPAGWDSASTYRTGAFPKKIKLSNGTITHSYALVKTQAELAAGKFFLPATNKYSESTREIVLGENLPAGDWTVLNSVTDQPLRYTICDLQPDDVVVGTYSTKGVLDFALTLCRRDSAGRTPEQRRQEYNTTFRVTARNAIARARSSH